MMDQVDESLRRFLSAELRRVNPRWQQNAVRITFDSPAAIDDDDASTTKGGDDDASTTKGGGDDASTTKGGNDAETPPLPPRLNIYLYDVRENTRLRHENMPLRSRPAATGGGDGGGAGEPAVIGADTMGLTRPPVRLDLSYLISAHASPRAAAAAADTHQLLSDALVALLRHARIPAQYLTDAITTTTREGGGGDPTSEGGAGAAGLPYLVAQPDDEATGNLTALWQAIGGKLRPVLALKVTATVQPFETRWTKVVREVLVGMGHGLPAQGGPRAPLDLTGVWASAAGIVTDASGNVPLPDVTVRVADHEPAGIARTDARGFWSLLSLPAGPKQIQFTKPGYRGREERVETPPLGRPDRLPLLVTALSRAEPAEKHRQQSLVAAGESGDLSGEWETSLHIRGTVRHADGRPAAYLPVRLGDRRTLTDRDGAYWFSHLPLPEPGDGSDPADDALFPVVEMPGGEPIALRTLPSAAVKNNTSKQEGKSAGKTKRSSDKADATDETPKGEGQTLDGVLPAPM